MNVGYVTSMDPLSPWAWSGTLHHAYLALQREGFIVAHVSRRLIPWSERWPRLCVLFPSKEPRTGDAYLRRARRRAQIVEQELAGKDYDVLVAVVASDILAFLDTPLPVVYISDATFRLLLDYYPNANGRDPTFSAAREECEANAIQRADLLMYPCDWAADSAVRDYGASRDKVVVIPFGANVAEVPPIDEILARRSHEACSLLFVGKDWVRKGGDLVYETLCLLNAQGVPSRLTICGTTPPDTVARDARVTCLGIVSKSTVKGQRLFHRLLMESHVMFVPSRAEAYGIVFCEAGAFALPSISTRTGGIPSLVEDGVNGFLLSVDAGAQPFADVIAAVFSDPVGYRRLAVSSRKRYEERLSWSAWGASARDALRKVVR